MDYLPTSLLSILWIGVASAQEAMNEATQAAAPLITSTDPLVMLLSNGGITLPTALIITVVLILRGIKDWAPTIKVEIKADDLIKIRLIEPRKSSSD